MSQPTLNAKGKSGGSANIGGNNQTVTIVSAANVTAGDIVIVESSFFTNQAPGTTTVGVVSIAPGGYTAGTFVKRSRQTLTCSGVGGTFLVKEVWWAAATSTSSSGASVVVTLNGPTTTYYCGTVFSVAGAGSVITPFDSALPAVITHASSSGSGTHNITGITSSSANNGEFLFGSLTGINGGGGGTPPNFGSADANFTLIEDTETVGLYMSSGTEYYTVFSSDYSSSTVSLFNGVATVYDFIGYVDGIVAAAPSANYGFNIAMGGM